MRLPPASKISQLLRLMKYSHDLRSRSSAGFTLMELLVVISIILILAGMSFAVSTKVLEKAKKARAANTASQLVQAISTYYTEYRKYPVKTAGGGQDTTVQSSNELMDVLLAAEGNELNPRRIVFFSGNQAKGSSKRYRGGVAGSGTGGGTLHDPFDKGTGLYTVVMDTNYNGRLADPETGGGSENIPKSVIAWSFGPDGEDDKGKKDDIATW